jgi:hypothetical protein
MKKINAIRNAQILTCVALSGVAAIAACTTNEVNSTDGGMGSSSVANASGTSSGSTSAGGSTSASTGVQSSTGSTLKSCGAPPAGASGAALVTDFSAVCPGDGGPNLDCFGMYPGFYGGSYSYAPTTDSQPNDAGVGCSTFGTQSTFVATLDTTNKAWVWSGEVAGFSGGGLWLGGCVDASGYSGIQFTVSGTLGAGADGGANGQMQLQVSDLQNWNVASAGGACLAADGGPGATCNPNIYSFDVPATAKVVQVPWAMLIGGAPQAVLDPSRIIQLQWQLPWACTGDAPYMANVTISNVQFYK